MIYQKMRLRRIERGALTLASAEVKFQIDTETHDPLDIGIIFLPLISSVFIFDAVQYVYNLLFILIELNKMFFCTIKVWSLGEQIDLLLVKYVEVC
jgi:hypothetical protein